MVKKLLIGSGIAFALISAASSLGSTTISIVDTVTILFSTIFHIRLPERIDPKNAAIVFQLRFPRVLFAFMVGGCLSVGGAVVQSVLKNPLASPYTMGVSSGASLGAALVVLTGITLPLIGGFTLPAIGFLFGFGTVYCVIVFSSAVDKAVSNNTIILLGMVVSLFVNALMSILLSLFREELKTLILWMLGSFSMKGWAALTMLLPFFVVGTLGIIRYTTEMDILSFGQDEAETLGVDTRTVGKRLLVCSAILTGSAVSLSGAIGFVDLVAPHIARRIVGSKHRYLIPMSFITGGTLMVITDLIARVIISPAELPVGAVTALIGAPFFAWVYFKKGRQALEFSRNYGQ
jgi:iron complex transport system permease protein